jgi:outer membrane protein assembly complex protein YaeT
LEAQVRVRVDAHPERKEATVTFRVEAGPRATIRRVLFDGDIAPLAQEELTAQLRAGVGATYQLSAIRPDRYRLESWLVRQGYRTASVGTASAEYLEDDRSVDLTYPVEVGPRFEFEVVGADRERLVKEGLLPFMGEQRYDDALAVGAIQDLVTWYQERGHYRVSVERTESTEAGVRHVVVIIEPGPVFELTGIEVEGNEAFTDEELLELMRTAPKRLLARNSGRLVDSWLEEDLRNVRSFYALEGYAGTRVGRSRVDEPEPGRLVVHVQVEESRRRTVADLTIEGIEALDLDLVDGLPLATAGPFHPQLLDEALEDVRARYQDAGYLATQVSATQSWNPDRSLVAIRLDVLEGPRTVVDRVIVRGYERSKPEFVRRAAGLRPGAPVNRRRLLEAQRNLYSLGAFSKVEVTLVPGTPYESLRDVLVRVQEGKRHRLSYGAGWDSEDGPRGLFGYSQGNLFGLGVTARLDLRASANERQGRFLVRQPAVSRYRLPVTYSLFGIEEARESFDSERVGAQVDVSRFGDDWRAGLLTGYRRVRLDERSVQPLDLDRDLQSVDILSLTPSYFIDRRDDPVEPTTGWSANMTLEAATPQLGGEAAFFKLFTQQTRLLGLGRLGVVAASLRVGAIEPGSGSRISDDLLEPQPSARIPISERFFAGGQASHRAYRRDELGRLGDTVLLCPSSVTIEPDGTLVGVCGDPLPPGDLGRLVPVGGNGLFLVNLDYRFPIAGAFGGTLFADFGSVWADWRDVDPAEGKLGLGAGVRYRSPIGPIRVEVAWKMDREDLEDPYEIFLSLGNPF